MNVSDFFFFVCPLVSPKTLAINVLLFQYLAFMAYKISCFAFFKEYFYRKKHINKIQ